MPPRILRVFLLPLLCACIPALAESPRLPFSGALGGTLGGGSATGWDRHGGGNPAAIGTPAFEASLTGYAPFGIEGLQVAELSAARDAARWGTSLRYRGLFDADGEGAAEARWQIGYKVSPRTSVGAAPHVRAGSGGTGTGFTSGILWRPHSALGMGAFREDRFGGAGSEARHALGLDAGGRFLFGVAWRVAAETHWLRHGLRVDRFGAGVRLHALLSVYAGWAPAHRSVGLGVRFGMGDWEGFSALRRHAVLGGTSVQGIRWRKEVGR